jgi:triacylglycerol lipase
VRRSALTLLLLLLAACADPPLASLQPGAADATPSVADADLADADAVDFSTTPTPDAVEPAADATPDSPPDATDTAADAAPDAAAPDDIAQPPKLGPPYPIVLAHGFFGADSFAGIGFATYFYGVREDLLAHGETHVTTPAVDPFQSSPYRGAQLQKAIEDLLAQTGHAKVVLIGHSQGGLDARWVAAQRPDLVAAVVTFSTPHQGTPVADAALGLMPWKGAQKLVDSLLQFVGKPVWSEVDGQTSLAQSMQQLSTPAMKEFNATVKDQPGVAYYSLAGRSALALAKSECQPQVAVPFAQKYDKKVDTLDAMLWATREVVDGGLFKAIPHDGLVRVADARWGTFLGCVPADHLDEIGHLFGDPPGIGNPFDHKAFYRELVAWLRGQGY